MHVDPSFGQIFGFQIFGIDGSRLNLLEVCDDPHVGTLFFGCCSPEEWRLPSLFPRVLPDGPPQSTVPVLLQYSNSILIGCLIGLVHLFFPVCMDMYKYSTVSYDMAGVFSVHQSFTVSHCILRQRCASKDVWAAKASNHFIKTLF